MKKPETYLRLGLGLMYLYSGIDIIRHPTSWSWAVRQLPLAAQQSLVAPFGPNLFLTIQGVGEVVFGLIFLLWFLPVRLIRFVAFLTALEMFLILLLVGIDAITFRDIGLLGAALALGLSYHYD